MGYILPVNQFQYQDYQARTIQTERSPFALERVFKASLDSKMKHDQPRERDRLDYQQMSGLHTSSEFHASTQPVSPVKKVISETVYSEVTGKGGNFSETI
ncbi:hypothetical protein [Halobacillus sp. H74]|uniref:hypothetical protein n=1 Tax=Halobacillus sp. H74 TaxID=3457436 RepID=UPI003FCE865E